MKDNRIAFRQEQSKELARQILRLLKDDDLRATV